MTTYNNIRVLAAVFLAAACLPAAARGQTDLYSFPEVEESKPKVEAPKPAEPFIQALSKRLEVPEKVLTEASEKGFGRMELIRLILTSKQSNKPLPDLIQEREKSKSFAKISEGAKVDNVAIKKEAQVILKDLEKEAEKIKLEVSRSTATAGAQVPDQPKK